ncbi:ATP-binding protein [Flavobacteriaceae bacterium TK19130]|nr:ATP-binding protein [Thermobacterium salinum]
MNVKSLLPILCLFYSFTAWSQDPTTAQVDSLEVLLKQAKKHYYDYDYGEAIRDCSKILELAEKNGLTYYSFRGYNELGLIHYSVKDTAKGRFYYEKALQEAERSQVDSLLSWAYNDLANVYSEDIRNQAKVIAMYEKAIAINKRITDDDYENLVQYINLAWTYLDAKKPKKAEPYLVRAKALSKQKTQHELLTLNLDILFARFYYYSFDTAEKVIEAFKEAAETAVEKNYLEQASTAYKYLAKAYERDSKFVAANQSLRKQAEIDNQLHQIEKETQLLEASAKFDLERYEDDLAAAEREKEYAAALVDKTEWATKIFIVASLVFLTALILIIILARNRKQYIKQLHEKNEQLTAAKVKAEELSKLKTQFFSTISHEIRTPLYGVIGLSSILLEDRSLTSHREELTSLKFSADYLLALINDVLLMNKMESGSIELEENPFSLRTLISNITKSFAFGLEQNHNTLKVSVAEEVPDKLLGDSIRLSQILMNLVGNAVKFNENGTIWIEIESIGDASDRGIPIQFSIKDDGVGIPEDKQEAIFEEFSQGESQNLNYQGTGLGLPIVKKLLALYKSSIALESTPGKGATFRFTLHLKQDPNYQHTISEQLENSVRPLHTEEGAHILIVDDNKINQKITQKILESKGFTCSLADDGSIAIALCRSYNYNLILMDIHMPEINGLDATKAIRKFNQTTPIVALTAVEANEIRNEIELAGMNDIILKPYDISQFLNTILRNLNRLHTTKAI